MKTSQMSIRNGTTRNVVVTCSMNSRRSLSVKLMPNMHGTCMAILEQINMIVYEHHTIKAVNVMNVSPQKQYNMYKRTLNNCLFNLNCINKNIQIQTMCSSL